MNQTITPHTSLGQACRDFVAHKRALGRKYATEENVLNILNRHLAHHGVEDVRDITPELLEAFLAGQTRTQPRSYNHRLGVVRRFFDWVVSQELLPRSPLNIRPRHPAVQRPRFLFDPPQIRRLLQLAADLPDNAKARGRGQTYHMIFVLLYGLGLRVGEVSRLLRSDLDLDRQLLIIRETKFSKSRLVPFGPRLTGQLKEYLGRCEQRRGPLGPDSPLFSFRRGQPIATNSIGQTFHQLLTPLGLEAPAGVSAPCVHCLRHCFAVHTLLHWYRAGIDPGRRLLHLSTFLGHVDPMSTAVYLTITADLLREAGRRFEHFATGAWKEG